jgi:acetyl esterase/lipase
VAEYGFDKKGNWLVMLIDAAGQVGNGVHLRDMKTGAVVPIASAKATYRGLGWNEESTAFTVLKGTDDAGYEGKWYAVLGFTELGPKPTRHAFDPKDAKEFPKDMAISPNRPAGWADGGDAFVFGIAERRKKEEPKKDATLAKKEEVKTEAVKGKKGGGIRSGGSPDAKPDLVVWHWKDERLQPMQQVQAGSDRAFTYTATYRLKDKKFLRLADESVRSVAPAPKGKFAVGRDTKPYEYTANLDGRRFADVYVIDAATGAKTKALTKARYTFTPSPTGTHFLYYDDGHFFVYDMAAKKGTNVTKAIVSTSFVNADDDHNVEKPPTQPVGWSRDGQFVLLSDGWDIWKVAIDGSGGVSLTGNGKKDGIRYQSFGLRQFEPDPKPGYDLSKPIYVSMYGEWTKKDGLARIDPGQTGVNVLLWDDCAYGPPIKARDADVFLFTRGTNQEYPDYYLSDATFGSPKKVTDANPQQKDYLWSAGTKLVEYKGVDGRRLQGALYLPANYEPDKKYPTVVYIYEKLSQGLHGYTPPGTGGFNKSIYTSNGYAVLTPDIAYRLNDPGKSAVECILPALDAAIATGVVDPAKVGLHGHSWGGYQTAFLVTQTDRFKAAIAGAPLTDLVSMYSSVYWNTGSANQPIFESSQGRFTGGYWDQQEAYIRNSPVYFAKNVTTPLVILHNDKDGAVDFTQGVEYYNTLRRLQKPVVMLQYKGENHGLAKPENRKDYAVRMREFFDHHLMGKPAPDWWAEGVPHLKMDDHLKGRKP